MVKDFSATTAATTTVTTITTECVVMAQENNSHTAQNVAATIRKQQLQNGQKQNGRRVEVEDECLLFCGRGKRQCVSAPEIANAGKQKSGSSK